MSASLTCVAPAKRYGLSVKAAAEYLGLPEAWVRGLVRRREVAYLRVGRGVRAPIRFAVEDLEAWKQAQTVAATRDTAIHKLPHPSPPSVDLAGDDTFNDLLPEGRARRFS